MSLANIRGRVRDVFDLKTRRHCANQRLPFPPIISHKVCYMALYNASADVEAWLGGWMGGGGGPAFGIQ